MTTSRVEKNEEIFKEIDEEARKRKNKKILTIIFWIFLPIFIIFSISYLSLRYLGNIGIVVREYPFYSEKLPDSFHGVKLVQFSCIHYNSYTDFGKLEQMVEKINQTHPDIVIFTGDLVDHDYSISMEEKENLIRLLNQIEANLGKYSILGEEDGAVFQEIFTNSNFTILDHTIQTVYKDQSSIQLIVNGIGEVDSSLLDKRDSSYGIVLTHMPDDAPSFNDSFHPDLILAAHSHNGQVRLPILGPIMKKEGSKKYIDSYYELNGIPFFITGGIGNTKYPFRLGNHPSINFIRLKAKTSSP